MWNNNNETKHHIVSPVPKTEGSSHKIDLVKKMQTMVEYLSTTPETDHVVAPLITTCCCLGLISTQKDDKEQEILVLKKDQVYFRNLIFQENSDQKVTICRVVGDDMVTSVSVTCPHLGTGDTM